jgi:hypothetical protein
MKPFHQVPGDRQCVRVAIASLFELPLEEVPFFGGALKFDEAARADGRADRLLVQELDAWLHARGLQRRTFFAGSAARAWGVGLAYGHTERGTYHAVVWDHDAGKLIHDPHPSGAGLLQPDEFVCFAIRDPALFRQAERERCARLALETPTRRGGTSGSVPASDVLHDAAERIRGTA